MENPRPVCPPIVSDRFRMFWFDIVILVNNLSIVEKNTLSFDLLICATILFL